MAVSTQKGKCPLPAAAPVNKWENFYGTKSMKWKCLLDQLLNQLGYPFPVCRTEILNMRKRSSVLVSICGLPSAFRAELLFGLHLLALCRDRLSARRLNSYSVSLYYRKRMDTTVLVRLTMKPHHRESGFVCPNWRQVCKEVTDGHETWRGREWILKFILSFNEVEVKIKPKFLNISTPANKRE